jgi:probable DNA metabolism protein
MNNWIYDKTFEGFLTLVFNCYEMKIFPDRISGNRNNQPSIFPESYEVVSNEAKAKRVWSGLHKKISNTSCQLLYHAFLSEICDVELLMLHYIREVFESPVNIELNFGNYYVLEMLKMDKKVMREAQRILMFTRFQKTTDEIYYAPFDTKYNVLPLVIKHFENRFTDQKWIIYDTKRNYGFYYDLKCTSEFRFTDKFVSSVTNIIDKNLMDKDEQLFQELWKNYFDAMCIKERLNPKLHMQLLPKRFWKYLTEKQPRSLQ